MADIYLFRSSPNIEVEENVRALIELARDRLKVFGADLVFEDDIWDVTDSVKLKGHGAARHRLIFSTFESKGRTAPVMMPEPFKSFAKAYLRYIYGVRPTKHIHARLVALRALLSAHLDSSGGSDPCSMTSDTFTRGAQLVNEKYAQSLAHKHGIQLEWIARFVTDNRLTYVPILWKNYLRSSYDQFRIGAGFDEMRSKKLPSEAALAALPQIYLSAKEPKDVVVSSVVAILCAAPDRISEVLALPENCEVNRSEDSEVSEAYGLRWWPAKGADPMVKWIIPSMVDVVREAIERIRRITSDARKIARWYEDNPIQIYLVDELVHLRDQEWITVGEVERIIGLDPKHGYSWLSDNEVYIDKTQRPFRARFQDVERIVLNMLPRWFPYLHPDSPLKFSDALCVVRRNELGRSHATYLCMIEPISTNQINIPLGSCVGGRFRSIFERHGYQEPDGSPIRVSTHQFRHYLNTIAQNGGLSQLDIAKWSGRKDVSQNKVYDHVTADQMLEKVRTAIGDASQFFGPLAEIPEKLPVSRDEFGRLRAPTAHTTDLGFCVHDYTMSPCQLHRDCLHCQDHVCIKGDPVKLERLKQRLEDARLLQQQAESAVAEGFSGSNRWLDHHRSTVERLAQLEAILENPAVPLGAVVQLAPPPRKQGIADIRNKGISAARRVLPSGPSFL